MTPLAASLGLVFGPLEIVLVLAVLIMIFGARKIPLLARGLGAGIRNFKGELGKPRDQADEADEDGPKEV